MDLLKAEIERKRKATEELKKTSSQGDETSSNKQPRYIRQRDVIALKQKEIETLISQSNGQDATNSSGKDESGTLRNPGSSNNQTNESDLKNKDDIDEMAYIDNLPKNDIFSRLREYGQPVTLFGESNEDRLDRLKKYTMLKKMDDAIAGDINDNISEDDDNHNTHDGDHNSDADSDEEADTKSSQKSKKQKPIDETTLYSQIPNYPKEKVIYKYFRMLVKLWEKDLNERDERVKLSAKGKMDSKIHKQCKDYIRPLMKMCKKRQFGVEHNDILLHLFEIVKLCEEGNFRLAHEEYLRTAIGNAAWPIGLTMVGIHERSGRERISTSKIAHVMNNEQERKYLTSVRRLMTYAQTKRPDIPPSMKVL